MIDIIKTTLFAVIKIIKEDKNITYNWNQIFTHTEETHNFFSLLGQLRLTKVFLVGKCQKTDGDFFYFFRQTQKFT